MNETDRIQSDLDTFEAHKDTEFAKQLLTRLSKEDAGFVMWLLTKGDICGRCFKTGPYCCYDSVLE